MDQECRTMLGRDYLTLDSWEPVTYGPQNPKTMRHEDIGTIGFNV